MRASLAFYLGPFLFQLFRVRSVRHLLFFCDLLLFSRFEYLISAGFFIFTTFFAFSFATTRFANDDTRTTTLRTTTRELLRCERRHANSFAANYDTRTTTLAHADKIDHSITIRFSTQSPYDFAQFCAFHFLLYIYAHEEVSL